ncbi:MAG TPA: sigma-54 dependent transcriptional regulator, partial [Candidatus Acidoferrales bacterium]|nr:sigma-54 dependent transcriptional regulator [Candidatus Acidoferrales bacterium]
MPKASILVVDDETEIREGLELLLTTEGYEVDPAETAREGFERLEAKPYDLILLDVSLPDRNGIELLRELRQRDPHAVVIMITAYGSIDMARAAFKNGALDYITKPWSNDELLAQVAQAVEGRRLREENVQLKRAFKERYNFPNIMGRSEKMLTVLDLVAQVAPSRSTVLISGESGTGKELFAKAIHSASPRADKPFVPVNTGSIPVDLLESQLFGHVKGAFTSAVASKKGLFEVADQGTIFFDEIATISPETQAKLLRVIQEREFMRLGGTDQIKVDVRIVAASNIDLLTLVREGRFREDLYHRLNVIHLRLPPLRDRREDIPALLLHFLERYCLENTKTPRQFTQAALKLLMDYDWPGNVRELENVVERAVVLSTQERVDVDLLPENIRSKEIVRGVRLQLSEFLPP